MAKLTYWVANRLNDSECYSIRAKTKKEVVARLAEYSPRDYDQPKKVTVEYLNAFDLMNSCMNEGRGYWEA